MASTIENTWPSTFSLTARNNLFYVLVSLLLVREISWWRDAPQFPFVLLIGALDDEDFNVPAAFILSVLIKPEAADTLPSDDLSTDELRDRVKEMLAGNESTALLQRLIAKVETWAKGAPVPSMGLLG